MTKGSKIRGFIWLILAIAGIVFIANASYTKVETAIDGSKIFEGKSEDQAGLEYLEIFSYKYEEQPIITVIEDDYSFDIHRFVKEEFNAKSNLYIVGKDITHDGELPKVGFIEMKLYCGSNDDRELVDYERLVRIKGTKVYVGSIEIDSCEGKEYSLIINGTRVEDGNEVVVDRLASFNLADEYDIDNLYSAAQVEEKLSLSKGFQGDLAKAGYQKYSWQKSIINGLIATVIMIPIAYGLYYSTEKELFGINIIKTNGKNKKNKK